MLTNYAIVVLKDTIKVSKITLNNITILINHRKMRYLGVSWSAEVVLLGKNCGSMIHTGAVLKGKFCSFKCQMNKIYI